MTRLKEMGESAAWHLMVGAALEGARQQGYGRHLKLCTLNNDFPDIM